MEDEKGSVAMQLTAGDNGFIRQEGNKVKQYMAALAVTMGAFAAGTVLSWSSPALDVLKNRNTTVLDEPIGQSEEMWIGSLLAIGALIGAFPTGFLADKIGRKWTILGLAFPFILSWILIAASPNVGAIYAARIFAGISTGGICVAAPLYIGEISESSVRGALGSFFQLLLTVGILFSYVVGALVNYTWLAILSGIVPVAFAVVFFFMPETPPYLLRQSKQSDAEKTLQWLRGPLYDIKPEIAAIKEEIDEAANNKAGLRDLVSSRSNINGLIVSLGLMIFQQLSGINAVIFYATKIFDMAGSTLEPAICSIIVGVVQVVVTYAATLLVDRAGRRVLLLLSAGVMCACLIILGVFFHIKSTDEETAGTIGWLPLLSVNVFIVCFSLGFGPLPWMMMSELFSSSIKEVASGLAVTLNWTLVFVVTRTFDNLNDALGSAGTFWLFGGITAVGFIFVFLKVPETKGKTFPEIQKILDGPILKPTS